MKRKVYLVVSALISIGVMGYLLSIVSLRDILSTTRDMEITPFLSFVVLSFGQTFFRTWRYLVLLNTCKVRVPALSMFLLTIVRNFFSDLFPARIGTLSYVYILTARMGVDLEKAISSFAIAFMFDMIAIVPLVLASLISARWAFLARLRLLGFLCPVILVLLMVILKRLPALFARGGRICTRSVRLQRFSEKLHATGKELERIRESGVYGRVFALSMLVRLCKYGALYFLLMALLSAWGYGWQDLGPGRFFLGISAAELSSSLPISGIAGFGAYEGTWAVMFSFLGFPREVAISTGISHHLITQVYGYSLGAVCLALLLLPFFRGKSVLLSRIRRTRLFVAKLASSVILLCGAMLIVQLRDHPFAVEKPSRADRPTDVERLRLREVREHLNGWILFESNRSGSTFGIYKMFVDGKGVRPIVDTEFHEIYPSLSPDGEWIAYARTKSLAKRAYSEIWRVKPDGTRNAMMVSNGTFPTWGETSRHIYFERHRSKAMRLDLVTGSCIEILPRLVRETDGYSIIKPRAAGNGRYVALISDRKGRWNSWIADTRTGEVFHVGKGCEPAWFPDGKALVWIGKGQGGTGIHLYELETGEHRLIQDLPPPRGHEYFPSVSRSGNYLLFSACAEHEHSYESPNYQIYIRPMGEETAVRISFDTHTNKWPTLIEVD